LELPDQEFGPFDSEACPAIGYSPRFLILVDASGRAVIPRVPVTPCGDWRTEAKRAVDGLGLRPHQTYRFETDL